MRDYFRCAFTNRPNFLGVVIVIFGFLYNLISENIFLELVMLFGFLLSLLCGFGFGTLSVYKKTNQALERNQGTVETYWEDWCTFTYCRRIGFKLALKDWEQKTTTRIK